MDGVTTGDKFIVYVKTGKGRAASDLSAFIIEKGERVHINCSRPCNYIMVYNAMCCKQAWPVSRWAGRWIISAVCEPPALES